MKTLKLTNTQYDLLRRLVCSGDTCALSGTEEDDYDNGTKSCEDIYGKNYRTVLKNLFKKLRIER